MNLDLLKKLTKLANHNNSEGEANSAARRVCKMLEEANWNLTPTKIAANKVPPSTPQQQGYPWVYRPHPAQEDWFGFKPGNPPPGSNRETKQGPTETYRAPSQDEPKSTEKERSERDKYYEEMFERMKKGPFGGRFYDEESNPFYNFTGGRRAGKSGKYGTEVRRMKCSKCGQDKDTKFVGRPEVFICQECAWSGI